VTCLAGLAYYVHWRSQPILDPPRPIADKAPPVEETPQEPAQMQDGYTIIARRTVKRYGNELVLSEFAVDSAAWKSLPKGLTQQQFYDAIMQMPVRSSTTTLLAGVPIVHPGPISNEDLVREFLSGADDYAKLTPALDPKLKFTKQDKVTLETLLTRELKSPVTATVKPLLGEERQVFLFPPLSRIHLKAGGGDPTIEMQINNSGDRAQPVYTKSKATITDENEQRVFKSFMKFIIVTEDPALPALYGKDIKAPIDNFYQNAYLKGVLPPPRSAKEG